MTIRRLTMYVIASMALILPACQPYDSPEHAEIDTSETGFLIPLEGDTGTQESFASEQYLRERKVAAKRVQITHRWVQTGRMLGDGKYLPTVRLVKVNRSPVTREWTAEGTTNAATKNHAVWVESADSVGFSMGFTATGHVAEDNAAKFLYWYPSGSLAQVMDTEVRARIQQVAAEIAAKYPLDSLRARKQEIADAIKSDVPVFFAQRGITITTIGMFGGMTYENPDIQKAIDRVFIDQQLKESEKARLEAQASINQRLRQEGEGMAERVRAISKGEGDAIRQVTQALAEAQQNPMFIQLRMLEIEKARADKWNGQYPVYFFTVGSGSNGSAGSMIQPPGFMLNLPSPGK